MNRNIVEQAIQIAKLANASDYEKAQKLLLDHLQNNPKDTEALLLLIRIECNAPLEYPGLIEEYANRILAYDTYNPYALLFLAYAQYYLMGGIDEATYTKLCLAKSSDPEMMAMIEVAKARYFESKNDTKNFEESLKRSINYSPYQQTNFSMLGKHFIKQGKLEEGKRLIAHGLKSVKRVIADERIEYDPTNIEDHFNYYYKGTDVMEWTYKELKSLVNFGEV